MVILWCWQDLTFSYCSAQISLGCGFLPQATLLLVNCLILPPEFWGCGSGGGYIGMEEGKRAKNSTQGFAFRTEKRTLPTDVLLYSIRGRYCLITQAALESQEIDYFSFLASVIKEGRVPGWKDIECQPPATFVTSSKWVYKPKFTKELALTLPSKQMCWLWIFKGMCLGFCSNSKSRKWTHTLDNSSSIGIIRPFPKVTGLPWSLRQ